VTVAPSNNFLYVASDPGYTSPGVYLYTIATDGSLTAPSGVSQTDTVGAMAMSADGKYLFTLSSLGQAMTQYSVDSTGTLSKAGALTVSSLSCALATTTPVSASCGIGTSPNNDFVVASFGTQGDYVFPYTSSGGITTTGAQPIAAGTASGDFSVAIDASDNAYIAQTSTMTVYGLTSTAVNNRGTISYASGSVPRSVTIGPSSKYVFTANQGTGTISSFTTGTTTALSSVSGSPFTGPAHVAALGVDNTGSYLVAVGYDATAGVQLFSISTTGVLASLKSAATSTATQYPVLVAMTH
jgi:6-phosphogluconolactonase (cycloisomerase 2 family)